MSSTSSLPQTVSALSFPAPRARLWLGLQIAVQLLSAALVLFMFVLAAKGQAAPASVLLTALALGFAATIFIVVDARFEMAWQGEDSLRCLLAAIRQSGYVEQGAADGAVVYRRDLPPFMRRANQLILIRRDGMLLTVSGPFPALRRIRKRLA